MPINNHHSDKPNAYLSFVSDAFLADGLADLVESTDAGSLSSFHQHVLFNEPGQLTLFRQHRQERTDKLVVIVSSPAVVDLSQKSFVTTDPCILLNVTLIFNSFHNTIRLTAISYVNFYFATYKLTNSFSPDVASGQTSEVKFCNKFNVFSETKHTARYRCVILLLVA